MAWKKLGQVFTASGEYSWMQTHAANPVAEHLGDGIFRIYFTVRDAAQRSHITSGTFRLEQQRMELLELSGTIHAGPGEPGLFDDSGCAMGCVIHDQATTYLFYLGWNLAVTVPWRNTIGLAIQKDGEHNFCRFSKAPLLDRSDVDPFTISYPWIIREGDRWHMWYGSNLRWGKQPESMQHVVKHATSSDLIHWERSGDIAVMIEEAKGEYALSKPMVLKRSDGWQMWYSYRGEAYRIGTAFSTDLKTWSRKDETAGITVSADGWDSEMVCYPQVFEYNDQLWMIYNGNGYGKTGFGLAVWKGEH